jgi:TetR/AcrR family transcriptional regulator, cholesterol catabolism regulator
MPALRAPRADNRLPQILDAAARLFRAQGFQGTSVRDIVRAVDMLPGSLYYHFATKEDLLAEVYAEGVRRISARVRAAVERSPIRGRGWRPPASPTWRRSSRTTTTRRW